MIVLTLNCGSSSIKSLIYNWSERRIMCNAEVERIGQISSRLTCKVDFMSKQRERPCPDHKVAMKWLLETISSPEYGIINTPEEIQAVGHRVVHGGDLFSSSVIITDEILEKFHELSHLAPLHNPLNCQGIEIIRELLPGIPNCAVMDTSWHQTIPEVNYMYALPRHWYTRHQVRKYGFHGTSYLYTSRRASVLLGTCPSDVNMIIAHIGNGSSICAVKNGISIDTSMGMTPLGGLIMGTRCGDIDPGIITYMLTNGGISVSEINKAINMESGLKGITGSISDRRDILKGVAEGNPACILARDMEVNRIKMYIGAYMAMLGSVDAIVFTGGVGETSPTYRKLCVDCLEKLGIRIDQKKNRISKTRNGETCISSDDSPVKIFVIPTDEELVIVEDTVALIQGRYDIHTRFNYSFQKPEYSNRMRNELLKKDLQKRPELELVLQ